MDFLRLWSILVKGLVINLPTAICTGNFFGNVFSYTNSRTQVNEQSFTQVAIKWVYILFFQTLMMFETNLYDFRICDGLNGLQMLPGLFMSVKFSKAPVFLACSELFIVYFKAAELSAAKYSIPPVVFASRFKVCPPL